MPIWPKMVKYSHIDPLNTLSVAPFFHSVPYLPKNVYTCYNDLSKNKSNESSVSYPICQKCVYTFCRDQCNTCDEKSIFRSQNIIDILAVPCVTELIGFLFH